VAGKSEAEIDELIRLAVRGDRENVDNEALRVAVQLAFELLDEDGDGLLSRIELLRGLTERPEVRKALQVAELTDAAIFEELYRTIDANATNAIDQKEFESYFLPRLHASRPAAEAVAERETRLKADAALKMMGAGHTSRSRCAVDVSPNERTADPTVRSAEGARARHGSASTLDNLGLADLAKFEDVTRGLERSQQRKVAIENDIVTLQAELRAVEAEILQQSTSVESLRQTWLQHRASHDHQIQHIDSRLRQLDHAIQVALRPTLRTADRS